MARRAIATVKSYGYKGGLWEEGQIIELAAGEKCPEYFKLLDGKELKEKAEEEQVLTPSGVALQELIDEAKSHGIKEAEILNQDELLEVLAKDTPEKRIKEIIKGAKARSKDKK